ncbi:MAG: 4-hydroxy-tetrahydrodipicolinate synthase [Alloprevotella sp.]|nr:4-hydroxy-tetrahydrodipicolinate synthase [Alloprevotella sp.]MDY4740594.1 4-hydroxy-tetrahydrodipicolinate synthase [Alloprevotella sp.]
MARHNIFQGMGVALVTPFDASGNVDEVSLRQLLQFHLFEGTDFLCILGTTAETPCLTPAEKETIKRIAVEEVGGRIPLLLGCGGNNTAAVVEYLQQTDLTGFAGVLIVTPFYNKPSQEGLYQHFVAVAQASPLPVVLYNVPGRTGVNLEAKTTLRIAYECENVVAVKEASGRIEQIEEIIRLAPEGFEVLSGDDAITFELMTIGAAGVISVIGNAYPKEFTQMIHASKQGLWSESLALHRRFSPLYPLMTADGNPAGIKSLLSIHGKIANHLRLPLVPATDATTEKLRQADEQFYK